MRRDALIPDSPYLTSCVTPIAVLRTLHPQDALATRQFVSRPLWLPYNSFKRYDRRNAYERYSPYFPRILNGAGLHCNESGPTNLQIITTAS